MGKSIIYGEIEGIMKAFGSQGEGECARPATKMRKKMSKNLQHLQKHKKITKMKKNPQKSNSGTRISNAIWNYERKFFQ